MSEGELTLNKTAGTFVQFKTKQRNRNKQSELQNQLNDN